MDDQFAITGDPAAAASPQAPIPEANATGTAPAPVPAPAPEAAPAVPTRVEGDNAKYYYYTFKDLEAAALSIDYGWIGVAPETKELIPETRPEESVVVIFTVPSRRFLCGYGIVLGSVVQSANIKDSIRRDLPSNWDTLVRVAWVRSSEIAVTDQTIGETDAAAVVDAIAASNSTAGTTFIPTSPQAGHCICNAIDDAAKRRLPRDARGSVAGQPVQQNRQGPRQGRGGRGRDMGMQQQDQYGYAQQGYGMPYQQMPMQQYQMPMAMPMGMQPMPQVDVRQFPDYESYLKWQREYEEYMKNMQQYQQDMYQQQAQGGAPQQQQVPEMQQQQEVQQPQGAPEAAPPAPANDGW